MRTHWISPRVCVAGMGFPAKLSVQPYFNTKEGIENITSANYISYQDALISFCLETLLHRRDMACIRFIKKVRTGQIESLYSAIIGTNKQYCG